MGFCKSPWHFLLLGIKVVLWFGSKQKKWLNCRCDDRVFMTTRLNDHTIILTTVMVVLSIISKTRSDGTWRTKNKKKDRSMSTYDNYFVPFNTSNNLESNGPKMYYSFFLKIRNFILPTKFLFENTPIQLSTRSTKKVPYGKNQLPYWLSINTNKFEPVYHL